MQETVVRPTTKFIRFGYLAVIVLIVGSAIAQTQIKDWPQNVPKWVLPAACALLLLWPISRHIEQRFTVMTIAGESCATKRECFRKRRGPYSSRRCRT